MHRPSPPTLERACGSLALLLMLILLALTIGAHPGCRAAHLSRSLKGSKPHEAVA